MVMKNTEFAMSTFIQLVKSLIGCVGGLSASCGANKLVPCCWLGRQAVNLKLWPY